MQARQWRAGLDAALAATRRMEEALDELGRVGIRGAAMDAMGPLDRSLRDAINHPAALVGYLDGHAARTEVRERLLATLPDYGWWRHRKTLVSRARAVCDGVRDVLTALRARPHFEAVAGAPTRPGPERTLQVTAEHLDSLALQVSRLRRV